MGDRPADFSGTASPFPGRFQAAGIAVVRSSEVNFFAIEGDMAQRNPLIGRWQSNKSETIQEMKGSGAYTAHQVSSIKSKVPFGELALTINADTITSYFQGSVDIDKYKLLDVDQDFVRIEFYNNLSEEEEIMPIQVRDGRMWMPSSIVNFREVFDRIPSG
jgi:hypothetical protein